MAQEMKYLGLVTGLADGKGVRLQVTTPGGQLREVPLTQRDLLRIIRRAADALEVMARDEERDGQAAQ